MTQPDVLGERKPSSIVLQNMCYCHIFTFLKYHLKANSMKWLLVVVLGLSFATTAVAGPTRAEAEASAKAMNDYNYKHKLHPSCQRAWDKGRRRFWCPPKQTAEDFLNPVYRDSRNLDRMMRQRRLDNELRRINRRHRAGGYN